MKRERNEIIIKVVDKWFKLTCCRKSNL